MLGLKKEIITFKKNSSQAAKIVTIYTQIIK